MKNLIVPFVMGSIILLAGIAPRPSLADSSGPALLESVQVCDTTQNESFSALEVTSDSMNVYDFYVRFDPSLLSIDGDLISMADSDGNNVPVARITATTKNSRCVIYTVTAEAGSTFTLSSSLDLIPHPCMSVDGVFPAPELCKTDSYDLNISNGASSTDATCKMPMVVKGDFSAGWGTCSAYSD